MTVILLFQELRNHPAFMTEVDLSKPLSKETEALMAMQYDGMQFSILRIGVCCNAVSRFVFSFFQSVNLQITPRATKMMATRTSK